MPALSLIRHGQASFGEADYDALTELGFAQARALGASLATRGIAPTVIVTGTMRRHRETATACLEAWRLSTREIAAAAEATVTIEADPAFDEFDHEALLAALDPRYADRVALFDDIATAPRPMRAFQAIFTAALERWTRGEHDADYNEPWPAFEARVAAGISRVEARLTGAGRGSRAWVFTSGGPIMSTVRALLAMDTPAALRLNATLINAGETRIALGRRGRSLLALNQHGALETPGGDLITYR